MNNQNSILDNPELKLWIYVVKQAIEDIVLFSVLREENKLLSEEDLICEQSAKDFLFDREHTIHFDSYIASWICSCGVENSIDIEKNMVCSSCGLINNKELENYYCIKATKEITLEELLSLCNIENVNRFREATKERIEVMKEKKRIKRKRQKEYRLNYKKE